jgi:hypothetical protein
MSGALPLFPLYAEMAEGQVTCRIQPAHRRIYGTIKMRFNQLLFDCHLRHVY